MMECGVFRGGLTIFVMAMIRAYEEEGEPSFGKRKVWVSDSFEGMPNYKYMETSTVGQAQANSKGVSDNQKIWVGQLQYPLEMVQENFKAFGLLNDNVKVRWSPTPLSLPCPPPSLHSLPTPTQTPNPVPTPVPQGFLQRHSAHGARRTALITPTR